MLPENYIRGFRPANARIFGPTSSGSGRGPRGFVTLAQQAGAEIASLPAKLAELAASHGGGVPWTHWDQELVRKVASDHHIPAEVVEGIETSGHSWLDDLITGLSGRPDEVAVLHRVRDVVRDLAESGGVVLVGHGSVYMTRDLPGGLHVRLVAPLEKRVENIARRFGLSQSDAARHLHAIDRRREAFFRRFFPNRPPLREMFDATFNTADLDELRIAHAIISLLPEMARTASHSI